MDRDLKWLLELVVQWQPSMATAEGSLACQAPPMACLAPSRLTSSADAFSRVGAGRRLLSVCFSPFFLSSWTAGGKLSSTCAALVQSALSQAVLFVIAYGFFLFVAAEKNCQQKEKKKAEQGRVCSTHAHASFLGPKCSQRPAVSPPPLLPRVGRGAGVGTSSHRSWFG